MGLDDEGVRCCEGFNMIRALRVVNSKGGMMGHEKMIVEERKVIDSEL